jgi:hypothetical protein
MRTISIILGLCMIIVLLCLPGYAQETTGTITGFVRDASGAVLPGVEVAVKNTGTGVERRVISGAGGEYTATLLSIGTYEVSAEWKGFKKFTAPGIVLSVNDRLRVDVNMQVGAPTETVTVVAAFTAVQSESAEVGSVVTGKQVVEMPLNGRSLYSLVALQPGVAAAGSLISGRVGVGLDTTSSVNVNGARAAQNNWLIDGADNVDSGSNLSVINYISIDGVSEFRILRGNYSAEFGRNGGGQINVVTKSGTNSFHGGAFEFFRNNALDARNFFSYLDRNGDGKADAPILRYNNFGYNLGGPVKKDKLFFFFNQEWRRVREVRGTGVVNTRVPTTLQKTGDFSEFSSVIVKDPLTGQQFSYNGKANVIPPSRLDPNAVALLKLFPDPNSSPAVLGGLLNFQSAAVAGRNYREELVRVDYELSNAHRIYGRFIHDSIPSTEPFGEVFGSNNASFPGVNSTATNIPARGVVAQWTWIPSPTKINDVAFNYSRGGIFSNLTGSGKRSNFSGFNSPEVYPLNPLGALPNFSFGSGSYGGIASFFGPYDNSYGSYRVRDTFSIIMGRHSIKLGYLGSWEFKNENAASGTNGSFNFPGTSNSSFTSAGDAFADFLLGRANSYSETDIDITSHLRYQMHEAFVQDDWKVKSNLTMNLGVRWSYILPPTDTANQLDNFNPKLFDPAKAYQINASNQRIPGTGDPLNGIYTAGKNSPYGDRIVASYADTFGPRFGFAWDPFKTGKTAIRGGYGIYFDRTLSGIALQNAFTNPPFANTVSYSAAGTTGNPTFANPAGGTAANPESAVRSLISMSPDFKVPTTQQWSFGVQRQLPFQLSVDASYVGNHGTHLLRAVRINQTPLGTAAPSARSAPFPGWGTITERQTSASSSYNSFQLGINRRMSRGIQFGIAYTIAKTLTDSPDDRTTIPQNSYNLRAERALASFDKSQIFVANYIWELPCFRNARPLLYNVAGGWQLGGIIRFESGTPLTPALSSNPANAFYGGTVRPDLAGNPVISANRSKTDEINQWFNIGAFATPAANTFGNAGRGIIRGPGLALWDVSIFKGFKATEKVNIQFRAELFNVLNHTNLGNPAMTLGNATFGKITSALSPRQIQFGLKFAF